MKALIVLALLVTVNSVHAEDNHLLNAAAAAAAAKRLSPTTVRAEKVSQCVEERLNLAKGRSSQSSVSSSVSTGSTSAY